MRIVLIGLAVLTITLPASLEAASAQPRPWCLQSGRGAQGGLLDCTYYSLQQCRGAIGGGTDACLENPAIGWDRIEGKRTQQTAPRGSSRQRGY